MHLFEPRWVDLVDTVLRQHSGIMCLVYVGGDGDVLQVATVAEVISCVNFGSAGRMVKVRGVGRATLVGLAPGVGRLDDWGCGVVKEIPEAFPEDLDADAKLAKSAAVELSSIIEGLDLSPSPGPASGGSSRSDTGASLPEGGEQEDEEDAKGPPVWTHERVSPAERFAGLCSEWSQRRAAVRAVLRGVPFAGESLTPADREMVEESLATFYAVLEAAELQTRLELFGCDGRAQSLTDRLRQLASRLCELQGMARARRALAGVFGSDGTESPQS